jgi:hypothetical protein
VRNSEQTVVALPNHAITIALSDVLIELAFTQAMILGLNTS